MRFRLPRFLAFAALLMAPLVIAAQQPPPAPVVPAPAPGPVDVPPVGEQIILRLALQPGQQRTQRQYTDQVVELGPAESPVRLRYSTTFDIRWDVLAPAPNGGIRVRWTFARASYHQESPEGSMTYDSAAPSGEPVPTPALPYATLVGQSIEASLSPAGDVTALGGAEALQIHMEDALAGLDADAANELRASLASQFSAEALRERAVLSIPVMPAAPVATGDSWGRQKRLDMGVPIDMNATYRLVERRDGKCQVESMAMLATANEQAGEQVANGTLSLTLTGEQRGRLEVDEASGMIVKGRYEQRLSGASRVQTPSPAGDGSTVTTETPTRLRTLTLIETLAP